MPWSFVVLSFNHSQLTTLCLESIITHYPEKKIYLIHNGTEDTQVRRIKQTFALSKNIFHIEFKSNMGYSGGANEGLKAVFQYENHVFFLTNDTLINENFNLFSLPSGIGVPKIINNRTKKIDSLGGGFIPSRGKLFHTKSLIETEILLTRSRHQLSSPSILPFCKTLFYVPGTAFFIDKNSFNSLKGFNSLLGTYWEDVDFSLRAQKSEVPIHLLDNVTVYHKIGKTCHKDKHYTTFLFQRNRLLISWCYGNSLEKLFLTFTFLKFSTLKVMQRFTQKQNPTLFFKALKEGVQMIVKYHHGPNDMSK